MQRGIGSMRNLLLTSKSHDLLQIVKGSDRFDFDFLQSLLSKRLYLTTSKCILGVADAQVIVDSVRGEGAGLDYVKRRLQKVLDSPVVPGRTPEELSESERKNSLELFRLHNSSVKISGGQMIKATVVHKDKRKLILDTGVKYATIGLHEITPEAILERSGKNVLSRGEEAQVGDTLQVFLESVETPEGEMLVTGQQAAVKKRTKAVWAELLERLKDGKPVKGRLLNSLSGGYSVGVAGLVCFLPNRNASRITTSRIGELADYRVIQMNASRSNVVLEDCRLQQRRQGKHQGKKPGRPRGELLKY